MPKNGRVHSVFKRSPGICIIYRHSKINYVIGLLQDESCQNVCTVVMGTELMLRQLRMGDVNVYVHKEIATQSDPSSDEYEGIIYNSHTTG